MAFEPLVSILMGSESDRPPMGAASETLKEFSIPHELVVSSAHRSAAETRAYIAGAEERGVRIFICGAGMSAALPGSVAAETTLPVLGVPLGGSALSGVDALYAIVQMPGGIPVGATAIGKAGAKNAAILAVQILALSDPRLADRLIEYRKGLSVPAKIEEIAEKSE
ncbi:MAG: 5-(carboxyamino)imidazole ribonucleotide mutase [Gemmatimonadetes bacterium]|nr:5-(carboxyamino)imidazole ribonucleotide mutase [Gemmatimonadota bacterium]